MVPGGWNDISPKIPECLCSIFYLFFCFRPSSARSARRWSGRRTLSTTSRPTRAWTRTGAPSAARSSTARVPRSGTRRSTPRTRSTPAATAARASSRRSTWSHTSGSTPGSSPTSAGSAGRASSRAPGATSTRPRVLRGPRRRPSLPWLLSNSLRIPRSYCNSTKP